MVKKIATEGEMVTKTLFQKSVHPGEFVEEFSCSPHFVLFFSIYCIVFSRVFVALPPVRIVVLILLHGWHDDWYDGVSKRIRPFLPYLNYYRRVCFLRNGCMEVDGTFSFPLRRSSISKAEAGLPA